MTSRTRDPARAALPAGVEVVRGDLTDAGTLTAAFAGVEAAHLITFTGAFGDTLTNGPEIVDALVAAGVARVSVLGGWDTGTVEPALDAAGVPSGPIQTAEDLVVDPQLLAAVDDHQSDEPVQTRRGQFPSQFPA